MERASAARRRSSAAVSERHAASASEARGADASAIIRRLNAATSSVPGVRLYMQPVQDLTIDTAVSATQYQVILENPNLGDFETWVPRYVEALQLVSEHQPHLAWLIQTPALAVVPADRGRSGTLANSRVLTRARAHADHCR